MNILITITSSGVNTGPFNLYSNVDGFTSAFAVGVSKTVLITGYSTVVPTGTVTVRIMSNGECTNFIDVAVNTTTSTTTTTTTTVPPVTICVTSFGASMTACFGGTLDEYMEGVVILNTVTPIDAEFTLEVGYVPGITSASCNNVNNFINLLVTVPSGSDAGSLTCPNAPFIDIDGATICSVNLIDGPYVNCTPPTPVV